MTKEILAPMFLNAPALIFEHARFLRAHLTDAEQLVWNRLKNKQLGLRFKCQHPLFLYIADFYCHKAKLVIEIDGNDHKYKVDYDNDREKMMKSEGIVTIRFTNEEVMSNLDKVIYRIKEFINQKLSTTEKNFEIALSFLPLTPEGGQEFNSKSKG